MGGEKWGARLASICTTIHNDELEERAYQLWQDGKLNEDLCHTELTHCRSEKKKTEKKKAKQQKKEEKRKKREANAVKKISLEEFMKKVAGYKSAMAETYTKPRSEKEWFEALAGVNFRELGGLGVDTEGTTEVEL